MLIDRSHLASWDYQRTRILSIVTEKKSSLSLSTSRSKFPPKHLRYFHDIPLDTHTHGEHLRPSSKNFYVCTATTPFVHIEGTTGWRCSHPRVFLTDDKTKVFLLPPI